LPQKHVLEVLRFNDTATFENFQRWALENMAHVALGSHLLRAGENKMELH